MKLTTSTFATMLMAAGSVTAQTQPKVQKSTNWAGAFVSNAGVISSAQGGFLVPAVNLSGVAPDTTVVGRAAVGIDLQNCSSQFLAGVQWSRAANGPVTYSAFTQWAPAKPEFIDLEINAGDVVDLEVQLTDARAGRALVTNAGGKYQYVYYSDQPKLCQATANWLVIDPVNHNSPPVGAADSFANFGQIDYTYPQYTVNNTDGSSDGYALTFEKSTLLDAVRCIDDADVTIANSTIETVPNDTNTVNIYYVSSGSK